MKLHLPRLLAAAVLAACVSAPAFAATTSTVTIENLTELKHMNGGNGAIVYGDDVLLKIQNVTNGETGNPLDIVFGNNTYADSSAIQAGIVSMYYNGGMAFILNKNESTNGGGGAIDAEENVSISQSTDEIIFDENTTVNGSGGAINAGKSVSIDHNVGNISFIKNHAGRGAGAIYAHEGGVTLSKNTGNILFDSNTVSVATGGGAAIRAYNGVTITDNTGDVTFTNHSTDIYGGTIYSWSNDVTISGNGAVSFSKSKANLGGAIFVQSDASMGYGNVVMEGNTSVSFSNNSCDGTSGGAIYAYNNISFNNNKSNSPDVLSGLYFSNNSANINDEANVGYGDGGALYAKVGYVHMEGNGDIVFESNHAVDGRGGAIYSSKGVAMKKNDSITFTGNTSANGGALYAASENVSLLNNYGDISFTSNEASQAGAAIMAAIGSVNISENKGDISFSHNEASQAGAAIMAASGSVNISENNGDISFTSNEASQAGAAIMAESGSVSISENKGDVLFDSNTSAESNSSGGAIYAATGVTIDKNIGDVTFNNHRSTSLSGGSIYNHSGDVSISGNGAVSFSKSTSGVSGGAIYANSNESATDGNVTLSGNTSVSFANNTAETEGGAIYTISTISLTGNGAIKFDSNTASTGRGGAIRGVRNITITGNTGNIEFTNNTAGTNGGAISNNEQDALFSRTDTKISGNTGDISFIGNKAGGNGGAIDLQNYGQLELDNNTGSITFSDNTAGGMGGAIYSHSGYTPEGQSSVSIANNTGDVMFLNNRAGSVAGAILVSGMTGTTCLNIRNNGNVLFEKNAVVDGSGNYLLRSIGYRDFYTNGDIRLSAAAGKTIEVRDSIAGDIRLELNEAYNGIAQTGDIIFTGAYTEQHLNELLQADGVNRQATEDEINASRQFTTGQRITVHGGRLRVEDGVVLTANSFQMKENAGATLLVKNATLQCIKPQESHKGDGNINITSGNTLQVEGPSEKDEMSALMFTLAEAQVEAGSLNTTIGAVLDTDTLTLHSGSSLVLNQSHIDLDGGCLTLNMLGEDKINLGLTLDGMLMEDSTVMLFSNIGTLKLGSDLQYTSTDTYEFYANQYFTGSMIGEDTMVQFQNGSMSVTGLVAPLVPEPTTATLSLLALAGLALRRRRK